MPFTNVSGSGSTVNVRSPRPSAPPPPRVVANPDNQQVYRPPPPPRVVANPDNQVQRSAPASSGFTRLANAMAVARANSGRPEGGPAALAGSSSAKPLARNAGASPAARISQLMLQRLIVGGDKGPFAAPFARPTPPFSFLQNMAPIQRMQTQGLFNQEFTDLQSAGLLPKGTKQPPLVFTTHEEPGAGAWQSGGRIYVPPSLRSYLANSGTLGALGSYAKESLVHELAHTMQSPKLLASDNTPLGHALVEGGAEAFAEGATPAAIGPLPNAGTYPAFVRLVRQMGDRQYMRNQFGRK